MIKFIGQYLLWAYPFCMVLQDMNFMIADYILIYAGGLLHSLELIWRSTLPADEMIEYHFTNLIPPVKSLSQHGLSKYTSDILTDIWYTIFYLVDSNITTYVIPINSMEFGDEAIIKFPFWKLYTAASMHKSSLKFCCSSSGTPVKNNVCLYVSATLWSFH